MIFFFPFQACREIFEPHTSHKRNNRKRLHEMCGDKNADVLQCVKNVTDMTPVTNSHKCKLYLKKFPEFFKKF